ncbi:MAG: hypothetical protein ABH836_04770 [Candidatus Omnitrophota bacterium]
MAQIGVDIDGIIADTDTAFRKKMKEVFKRDFPRHLVTQFNYEKCFEFTEAEERIFYGLFVEEELWANINLIKGARNTLNKLNEKHSLIIITGRPVEVKEVTIKWLREKEIPFDKLYFMQGRQKHEVALQNGHELTHFMEDHPDYAFGMAEIGVNVFLMDYPWNQKIKNHPLITRVKDWRQINKMLEANKLL